MERLCKISDFGFYRLPEPVLKRIFPGGTFPYALRAMTNLRHFASAFWDYATGRCKKEKDKRQKEKDKSRESLILLFSHAPCSMPHAPCPMLHAIELNLPVFQVFQKRIIMLFSPSDKFIPAFFQFIPVFRFPWKINHFTRIILQVIKCLPLFPFTENPVFELPCYKHSAFRFRFVTINGFTLNRVWWNNHIVPLVRFWAFN